MIYGFLACIAVSLKWEGGYSNDKKDPGGLTLAGVTQKAWSAWCRKHGLPPSLVTTSTHEQRLALYREGYWDPIKGDTLPDGVNVFSLDTSINSGPGVAIRFNQRADKTSSILWIKSLAEQRLSLMHALPTWSHFGRGWGARVGGVEALALRWAMEAAKVPQTVQNTTLVGHAVAVKQNANRKASKHAAVVTGGSGASVATHAQGGIDLHVLGAVLAIAGVVALVSYLMWRAQKARSEALAT